MLETNSNSPLIVKPLDQILLKGCRINVKLTDLIINKVKFLCREIAREEWSGVLFYSVEGTISDPINMVVTLEDLYPMDKGSAGATSYAYSEEVVGYRMDNPKTNYMQIGHMHSHNSMSVFFSGTDTSELTDNVGFHNYYLSVIVNNYFDIDARIAFKGVEDSSLISGKNENGEPYSLKIETDREVMFYYDCNVIRETLNLPVDDPFRDRVKHIIVEAAKPKVPATNQLWKQGDPTFNKFNWENKSLPPFNKEAKRYTTDDIEKSDFFPERGSEDLLDIDDPEDADLQDFLVDLMLSNEMVKGDTRIEFNPIITLDDMFTYLDTTMSRKQIKGFMEWYVETLPEFYTKEFDTDDSTVPEDEAALFLFDLNAMIQIVEEFRIEYRSASKLNQHLTSLELKLNSVTV